MGANSRTFTLRLPIDADVNDSVFLGRQPLIGRNEQTVAYRLFVADGIDDANPFGDSDLACRRLLAAIAAANLDELIAGKDSWIPITVDALGHGLHSTLPPKRTILALAPSELAKVGAPELVERARRVGFRVALDLSDERADARTSADPFGVLAGFGISDVDGFAIRFSSRHTDSFHVSGLEASRRGMLAVALGVDSTDDAGSARGDFDLRAGAFFLQPVAHGLGGSVDRLAAMQLLAELERPNSSFEDVERVITRDPSLVLRMLSLVNSGLFSLPKRIDTTRSALVMLGLRNVRQLALAVTLNSVTSVPAELTLTSLIRARQCEHVAAELDVRPEPAFTVGLLSLVGAFAGMSTADALASLPLTAEVVNAITRHTGLLGEVLDAVLCCEENRLSSACHIVDAISPAGTGPAANISMLAATWINAVKWAERLRSDVGDVAAPSRR